MFRTGYESASEREAVSVATGLSMSVVDPETGEVYDDPGVAQQQFKEECDINEIVRRFGLTGHLPENVRVPQSGDFTGITDFSSAMQAVRAAQESFMELPAETRARFNNDPQKLIEFCEDGKNRDEAIRLGLVALPPERPRDVVQAVDELAASLKPEAGK